MTEQEIRKIVVDIYLDIRDSLYNTWANRTAFYYERRWEDSEEYEISLEVRENCTQFLDRVLKEGITND